MVSEISNLQMNGVKRPIKDATARQSIVELSQTLEEDYVKKEDAESFSSTVYLTKSEYDALGNEVLTNGVTYGITDIAGGYNSDVASTTQLGLVKVDGTTITADSDGTLHGASTYTLPNATTEILGGVKPDGTSISVDENGKITSNYTNENLLDNPFFTVNQRGGKIALAYTSFYFDEECTQFWGNEWPVAVDVQQISNGNYRHYFDNVSTYGYFKASDVVDGYVASSNIVDRWLSEALTVTKVYDDHIILECVGESGNRAAISQVNKDNISKLNGKVCTFSYSDGTTIYSGQFTHGTEKYIAFSNGSLFYHTIWQGFAYYRIFTPEKHVSATLNIYSTKLELGSTSTLANDVAPDYETELIKCKTSKDNSSDTYANKVLATMSDSLPANGGNSTTVNNHTVNADVPANAVFTDTNSTSGSPAVATQAWRNIYADTTELTAGTSDLATGTIYVQYE